MTIWRTDEELMLRYRDGDAGAFETLYRRYEKPLFDFIYRLVPDSTDTESLFQETFFRVVRAKRKYRATAQFKTWLFQIAVNLCRDRTRRMKHRSHLSLNSPRASQDGCRAELQDLVPDPSPAVGKSVEDSELEAVVKGAVAALPEDEHLVVVLREYQGMNYSEIAAITNRPIGTLKSINHRAHERLRSALAPYLGE
ncbi:MAG: sigma-70 family RNA polymerase sigma factor [Candidatus Aminicenantes bacterium]|nr:sigma-70 family RNA polymerase sigma factor [Candidatus Aminicenantes bacterium]